MDIVVMIFITFAPHSVAVLTNPPVQNICRCRFLKTFPHHFLCLSLFCVFNFVDVENVTLVRL